MQTDGARALSRPARLSGPALFAVACAAILVSVALFVPPVIGMADNGDFYRVTYANGLYFLEPASERPYLQYFIKDYGIAQYFVEHSEPLFTAQAPFIRAAVSLDKLFTRDAVFDLRFLGGVTLALFLAALYLLVDAATYEVRGLPAYGCAALCVVIFADTGYTAYFNSFYAEGLMYVFFLLTMACALLAAQGRGSPAALLAVFTGGGLALIFLKQQNAPLGIFLGALCLLLYAGRGRFLKWASAGCAALLAVCGIAGYLLIPAEFVTINQYHAMTRGLLPSAEDPEKTLEDFGMNPQYALLEGQVYFDPYPVVDPESAQMHEEFYPRYSYPSVAMYYLTHPGQLSRMLTLAAQAGYDIRPRVIGNFEASAGRDPGAQTRFFTLYSTLKQKAAPRTVGFVVLWAAVVVLVSFRDRRQLLIFLCALLMGLVQVAISIIGAGDADLAKHVFLYNVAFDFINAVLLCRLICARSRKHSRDKAAKPDGKKLWHHGKGKKKEKQGVLA